MNMGMGKAQISITEGNAVGGRLDIIRKSKCEDK